MYSISVNQETLDYIELYIQACKELKELQNEVALVQFNRKAFEEEKVRQELKVVRQAFELEENRQALEREREAFERERQDLERELAKYKGIAGDCMTILTTIRSSTNSIRTSLTKKNISTYVE